MELIKCTFESGLQLVSNVNTTAWRDSFPSPSYVDAHMDDRPDTPRTGPHERIRSPFFNSVAFEWARSAANIYQGPEERRLRLDTSTFITAYGRHGSLAFNASNPSQHRLTALTPRAARDIKTDIESSILSNSREISSGIDWRSVTDLIVVRYGHRLSTLLDYLTRALQSNYGSSKSNDPSQVTNPIMSARMLLATLLAPHYDLTPGVSQSVQVASCVSSLVPWREFRVTDTQGWSGPEHKLSRAVDHVQRAICNTLIVMNDELAVAALNEPHTVSRSSPPCSFSKEMRRATQRSQQRLMELMNDLRWTMWRSCDRKCDSGEICFVSNWRLYNNRKCSLIRIPQCE